ncbi:MAG TPA: tetratricopeptide repeat protein, partial [Verrucomicrobiae bacterium]|nr:tetratricopeptide repeat protein [Verrucomicrobiae bacterium]
KIFAAGGLIHQAIILLTRVTTLAPYNLNPQLMLAHLYLYTKLPDPALKLISDVHSWPNTSDLGSTNQTDLLAAESIGLFMQNKKSDAQRLIGSALQQNPDNTYLLNSLFQVSLNYGDNTNALTMADRLLRMNPDDTSLLVNKAYLNMQLGDVNAAIAALDHVLTLETNNYKARFNRAICYLRVEKYDESRKDYEILQKTFPDQFQINYGLGEIAFRKRETNAAVQNYEIYLQRAPTNTTEAAIVSSRVKELKGGKP